MKPNNDIERLVLQRLKEYAENDPNLTPSDAWKLLSTPKKIHKFKKKISGKNRTIRVKFEPNELGALETLKKRLINELETASGNRCSYCKRHVGKHGWSWHIEHVKCKRINKARTFDRHNLVLACVDCNFHKNQNVDRFAPIYQIIDPSAPNFNYSTHLNYLQISTERLHILRYRTISTEGTKTYSDLKFKNLEYEEAIKSLNREIHFLFENIDTCIGKISTADDGFEIAEFLLRLKERLLNP